MKMLSYWMLGCLLLGLATTLQARDDQSTSGVSQDNDDSKQGKWRPALDFRWRLMRDFGGDHDAKINLVECRVGAITPWLGSRSGVDNYLNLIYPSIFWRGEWTGETDRKSSTHLFGLHLESFLYYTDTMGVEKSRLRSPLDADGLTDWKTILLSRSAVGYMSLGMAASMVHREFPGGVVTDQALGFPGASPPAPFPEATRTSLNGTHIGAYLSAGAWLLEGSLGAAREYFGSIHLDEITVEANVPGPLFPHTLAIGWRYRHTEGFTQRLLSIGVTLKF